MKKTLILTSLLITATLALSACTGQTTDTTTQTDTNQVAPATLPARPAEVNGIVKTIEGNEIVIMNELKEALSDEDRAAKQAERANLSQEERQALRQQELEATETEQITLQIPVGVPIMTGSGSADGSNVTAQLSDIKAGSYLSIWQTADGNIEAVKIKGLN